MIEFALATFLKSRPTVSARVGTHVYAEKSPQGVTAERIVYSLAGGDRHYHTLGSSGLCEAAIRLTFHAPKGSVIDRARSLYDVVRNQIDGYRGTMDGVVIHRCVMSMPAYGSAVPTQGDEVGSPAVNAVVEVHFQEPLPTGV